MIQRREDVFEAWAPASSRWSAWAKPVLFAHLPQLEHLPAPLALARDNLSAPPADGRTAIVVDLPAADSVALGLALARRGYRPVPLFNAAPGPVGEHLWISSLEALVELRPAMGQLWAGAAQLASLHLPDDAPPAFLLDAHRRPGRSPRASTGDFDNRSVSFPTDFPSAATLSASGVGAVLLIQETANIPPQSDVAHTLLRWQNENLAMLRCGVVDLQSTDGGDIGRPYVVTRPSWFGFFWYRLLVGLRLRPNLLGGFGGFLPESHSTG